MKQISKNTIGVLLGIMFVAGGAVACVPAQAKAQTYYDGYEYTAPMYPPYSSGYGYYPSTPYYVPRPHIYRQPYYQPQPVYQQPYYSYSPLSVSCNTASNGSNTGIGNYITWTAYTTGGSGYYTYIWTGTDSPTSLDMSSIGVSYSVPGTKTMSVTVTSGDGQTATAYCGSVYVNDYNYGYGSYYPSYNYQYPYQYSTPQYSTPAYPYSTY